MERTLAKNSNILLEKSKFFLNRVLIYFSFLLLPVWIQKTLEINIFVQSLMMFCYLIFMAAQWYLLGKEIDHRVKIYFRANSSIDRVLYRLVIGNATMMIVFNLMSFIPDDIVKHFFWGFFVCVGLFYSWPTRGKIIEESVTSQFTEYKYLDAFEKTVLFLIIAMLVVSMPSFTYISNLETYKLIVDPDEKMNTQLWSYLYMNFFPFRRFPHLINLGWSMHFYYINLSMYLLAFYGILRFFISRRLSILGLFALVSTWSFSLFLKTEPYACVTTTFSVLWVWSILWCVKSATYRSGLMYGLLCFGGVVLNYNHFILFPIGLVLLYFYFLNENTDWYRGQFVKYTSMGMALILITLITHIDLRFFESGARFAQLSSYVSIVLKRKAFFSLAAIGFVAQAWMLIAPKSKIFAAVTLEMGRFRELTILAICVLISALIMEKDLLLNFGMLWYIAFLSILPLELIFQSISRLRSRRNIIYAVYVVLCLLDSHFEGRVRILYNFYQSPPDIVELLDRKQ